MTNSRLTGLNRATLTHVIRTTVAATVSLAVARLFRLPEAYWAPISTMVVTQSNLGAALTISGQRFVGTVLGAAGGALIASYVGTGMWAFAAGVFALGLVCAAASLDRAAYRFAGITLAIIVLAAHSEQVWTMAAHRFFEVSLGIAVGLIMSAVWPEAAAK
jgi:uncharacterized membrane protein YgaE (UPF0421/DUF939 family)